MLNANKDKIAVDFEVLDLDTGEFLNKVFEVNQETGEYKQYLFDKDGQTVISHKDFDYTIKQGNIVLVYKGN
jgi:hypothetical protein